MPRLEDGELVTSASKFKKRRAWITSDEADLPVSAKNEASGVIDTPPEPSSPTRVKQEHNKSKTKVEHDYNKSITRVEHERNKTITGVEQKNPQTYAAEMNSNQRLQQECNKSVTRVEHDYNMSITRVEHEYNKSETRFAQDSFSAFLVQKRVDLLTYEDDARCLLLSLSDVQRRMFWHVAFECISRDALRTGPIEIKGFFSTLELTTGVMRTSLNRLTEKRLLQREKGKLGKNGFAIIALPKSIYEAAKEIVNNFQSTQSKQP